MKMKKHVIIFFLIIILATFFRIAFISTTPPGLYPDEAMNGNNALEAAETGNYKVFYPENNGREGFFINIQASFLKLVLPFSDSPEPWMLRIPSALFGILTVAGIYFLTKELFRTNLNAALFSSFFLAISFWHINFSRIGFRAIMAPCFLVWGIYLLLLTFRKSKEREAVLEKNPKYETLNPKQHQNSNDSNTNSLENWKLRFGNSIPALLAGMVYGLGMHSYIAYRATPAIILFIFFLVAFYTGWKKTLKTAIAFSFGAIATSLPLIIYFLKNPSDFLGRTSQVSVFGGSSPIGTISMNILKTIGMLFYQGDSNWRHNFPGYGELLWLVAIFFVVGVIIGIRKIFKRIAQDNSKPFESATIGFWILFGWIAVAMLPVIISNEGIPHALRSILMIPPVFICAGIGASFLYEKLKIIAPRMLSVGVLSLCVVFTIFYAYCSYFILWGKNPNTAGAFTESYTQIGHTLNSLPKSMEKYVVVEAGGVHVRGIPMPTQTTMFITDTFTSEKQKQKNIFYILPDEVDKIPPGSFVTTIR